MTTMALGAQTVSRRAGLLLMAGALLLGVAPSLAPAGAALSETAQAATAQLRSGAGSTATDKIDPALLRVHRGPTDVIVSGAPGQSWQLRNAIEASGGTVSGTLPMVSGFRASVPAHRLVDLAGSPVVTAVTKNRVLRFEELSYDDTTTASSFARTSGATTLWGQGTLGSGVGVAVLDTGVSPMNDFDGRLVHGPDLSGEGTIIDSYGHGTVMAGIVGGSGADSADRSRAYTGVAPKSTLVAVKVAGANGVTDVSTVLQGLHWVSAYKDQFNIRVLNLSWGVASTQSPAIDPLNYAVQRLWQQGVVVVVAAGNAGPTNGTILKPADDPLVITAGAFDDKQNVDPKDDNIPAWSSRGPTATGLTKPDLVAPGRTLIAARSLGSTVEKDNPKALISPTYIKGSGSSEAAAVTSGAAALLLQARPELTPDQVKAVLTATATPIPLKSAYDQGKGRLNLAAALTASPGLAVQQISTATGLGSIEASRGGRNIQTDCNNDGTLDVIKGEIDARCEAWTGAAWTGAAWTGAAWTGAAWTGAAWTGAAWTGAAWTGAAWTGAAWTGGTWNGAAWTGAAWTGAAWTGSLWTGAAWTGAAWTGAAWTGAAWTGSEYTSAEYDSEFLNAWWGGRPKYGMKIAGEESAPRPANCRDTRQDCRE